MLLTLIGLFVAASFHADDQKPNEKKPPDPVVIEALKEVQDIVGEWEGFGKEDGGASWDEQLVCQWKFANNGRVSLHLTFADKGDPGDVESRSRKAKGAKRLFDEAIVTYSPEKKSYLFRAYVPGHDDPLEFVGKKEADGSLSFDRSAKGAATDKLDRIEFKLLGDGDRLVYSVHRRIGKSTRVRSFAQAGLNRKGTSLAAKGETGPKCIVTGGTGTIAVTYKGQTYYVCCSGCRDAFLAEPETYLARSKK